MPKMSGLLSSSVCKICQAPPARKTTAQEMMFGLRDRFEYAECSSCGSLQLAEIPADLGKYYPPDYYSFQAPDSPNALKRIVRNAWYAHLIGDLNPLGALL